MKKYLALFLLATAIHAQTAKVIALDAKDAAKAKSLHDQQEALKDKIELFTEAVKKKYLEVPAPEPIHTFSGVVYVAGIDGDYYIKPGWSWGDFLYSDDFKYIVPAPQPPVQAWTNNGCAILSPANIFDGGSHAN